MQAWNLARIWRCQRGNAALVSAAALPLLLSSAALAYDTVQLAIWMQQLQEVTDASATAGARALAGGRPVDAAIERAIESDRRVLVVPPVRIEGASDQGSRGVRVVLTSQRSLTFLGAVMTDQPTRSAHATAIVDPAANGGARVRLLR
jgi:Flp pilus assembly protein TadG